MVESVFDGTKKCYVKPGIPISQKGWTKWVQAIPKRSALQANTITAESITKPRLKDNSTFSVREKLSSFEEHYMVI